MTEQLLLGIAQSFRLNVSNDDISLCLGKGLGDAQADAARTASDKRCLVCEILHGAAKSQFRDFVVLDELEVNLRAKSWLLMRMHHAVLIYFNVLYQTVFLYFVGQ